MTSSTINSQTSPPHTSSSFSSFSDLLSSAAAATAATATERTNSGIPKFKSTPPPLLPIAPTSSYFSLPGGLSPADLLDSPVLLSSYNNLPSPTTGTFAFRSFNWNNLNSNTQNQEVGIKKETKTFSDFSFQSQLNPSYDNNQQHKYKDEKDFVKSKHQPPQIQSFSQEISTIQTNSNSNSSHVVPNNNHSDHSSHKTTDDGYNWRKYGQKQVKGSEFPRSYYKCTYPKCSMRKKVEKSFDGQITEIVYKGNHNHVKPQATRRSSSSSASNNSSNHQFNDYPDQSYGSNGSGPLDLVATPENSSISIGDDFDRSRSGGDEVDEDEPKAKIMRMEDENEGISTRGSKTVREPRVVVQTISDIDILDDGFRWRKYGQKVVKGNPNPRSYYKCTTPGCSVRKHVERASHDLRSVITTYEGRHNHDLPLGRGTSQRPSSTNPSNNVATMAIRTLVMSHHDPNNSMSNPIRGSRLPPLSENEAPFTLQMLQGSGSFGFSGFENPLGSNYMNPQQNSESVFSKTKEESRDDMFLESLLC